jgi:hypothetical protein
MFVADVINDKNIPDKDDSNQGAAGAEDWEAACDSGEITLRE